MNLYGNLAEEKAMAGLLYGMNPKTIVSVPAKENIAFGKGVFFNGKKTALLNGKRLNNAVVDLSGYTTASKVIALTINGIDVSVTTSGTVATDVAHFVTSIGEYCWGISAVAGTSTDNEKLFITSDDESALEIKVVYDGDDVTATKATLSSDAVYAGVSIFHQNSFINSRGFYVPNESVNVMEKGYVWVVLARGATPSLGANAYVTADGTFTTESSGNTLVGKFKSGKENGIGDEKLALISLD